MSAASATPTAATLPQDWLKLLQENSRLKADILEKDADIARLMDSPYADKEDWRKLRHADADPTGHADGVCSHCGDMIEDDEQGICVFDSRGGRFKRYTEGDGQLDFFCDHLCLAEYGRMPIVKPAEDTAMPNNSEADSSEHDE